MAVDGGTHLAAIVNIFDEHLPRADRGRPSSLTTPDPPTTRFRRSIPNNAGAASPSNLAGYFAPIPEAKGTRTGSPVPFDPSREKLILTSGPFADLMVPYENAKANAAHLLRNLVSTYLITHPHLDHLSGFAINTASFQHTSRPKKVAALPSTINAIKTHIFNDIIWPNLSDEEGGVGLVSYMRLAEGGNIALGDGEGRGYIEVVDGLAVKCWSVSHGHCTRPHNHRGTVTAAQEPNLPYPSSRRPSRAIASPTGLRHARNSLSHTSDSYLSEEGCVVDSSAFFIRDDETGKEVLIFGDVEPDSISLSPRTARVWEDAAPKIAAGLLSGIFIECSYDDSQSDDTLFGHLAPRHLIAELQTLADKVSMARRKIAEDGQGNKRKRMSNGFKMHGDAEGRGRKGRNPYRPLRRSAGKSVTPPRGLFEESSRLFGDVSVLPSRTSPPDASSTPLSPLALTSPDMEHPTSKDIQHGSKLTSESTKPPLHGLRVIIIHVKDTLSDGPPVADTILAELRAHEAVLKLGCAFSIAKAGTSVWL